MSDVADTSKKVVPNFDTTKAPRVDNKIIVITGANSGIGYFNALDLATKGAQVVLACRNEERGKAAETKINEAIANVEKAGKAIFMKLDTSSLASVKSFSEELHKKFDRINILINNAGIMAPPFAKSVDGFESQFATNHLGHFALTGQLLDLLKKGAPSRIINVSSIAHRQANATDFDDILPKEETYSALGVYRMTKISNLFFTYELERRLRMNKIDGVIAVASHPGVSSTNLFASTLIGRSWFIQSAAKALSYLPLLQSAQAGSLPTLYAATVENVSGGEYYGPDGFKSMWGAPTLEASTELSHNEEIAKKLWTLSEKLTKTIFKF
jgi:NAD(P)-dependent dehydrogenase (short-subunit alcohol dehydrogenase family)